MLKYLLHNGNVTYYEWKFGSKPISVEAPILSSFAVSVEDEVSRRSEMSLIVCFISHCYHWTEYFDVITAIFYLIVSSLRLRLITF